MSRAWFHGRSAVFVAWLMIEPPLTRIVTECRREIDGARRGQELARRHQRSG